MSESKQNQDKRPVGAPITVNGKRINVYLDEESIRIAAELGDGNISEGIRKALKNSTFLIKTP